LQWLLYGDELVRSIGATPDPWETWEWRTHLGQPASLPQGEPATLEATRIAYDIAIADGDAAAAARWRTRIDAALDHAPATAFTNGVRLIGVRRIDGVEPRVESWFERSPDAGPGDVTFDVRSTVEARAAFSLIPPSPTDRAMAFPPTIATKLWRPGFLYVTDVVLNHRIGRERYWGAWRSRDGSPAPRRVDGQPQTTLAVLP
jgi:hypothetical protein